MAAEEGAGSQITLQVPDDFWQQAATLAPTTARHAHRIVQESLTNARKHAGGQPVSLRVDGGPDAGLQIQVVHPLGRNPMGRNSGGRNGGEVPGAGLGLAGLQERASLAGGSLGIEERDGFFRVTARLPWNVRAS